MIFETEIPAPKREKKNGDNCYLFENIDREKFLLKNTLIFDAT